MVVFEEVAGVLVVLHAAAAIVLIGASTHHAIVATGYLRGIYKVQLGRIYAATTAVAYVMTFGLGALAYPAFRYHARELYLDEHRPWASNLFDIKEHFASLGLPMVVLLFVLSRCLDPRVERSALPAYSIAAIAVCGIVWFNVFSGLIITLEKGV